MLPCENGVFYLIGSYLCNAELARRLDVFVGVSMLNFATKHVQVFIKHNGPAIKKI